MGRGRRLPPQRDVCLCACGMNAAACCWIVRDRLGIKPLYYRHEPGRRLLFASEIKSILAHPDVPRDVDPQGLFNFMAYGHAVGPDSIYRGIHKLMPGHALRIERGQVSEYAWWNVVPGPAVERTDEEWRSSVRTLLEDSIRRQMVADVPVGAFLSGGLDSSAVVALMQRNTSHRVRTFSVGFDRGGAYNELAEARRVAEFLGTEHHELLVTSDQLRRLPAGADLPLRRALRRRGVFSDLPGLETRPAARHGGADRGRRRRALRRLSTVPRRTMAAPRVAAAGGGRADRDAGGRCAPETSASQEVPRRRTRHGRHPPLLAVAARVHG